MFFIIFIKLIKEFFWSHKNNIREIMKSGSLVAKVAFTLSVISFVVTIILMVIGMSKLPDGDCGNGHSELFAALGCAAFSWSSMIFGSIYNCCRKIKPEEISLYIATVGDEDITQRKPNALSVVCRYQYGWMSNIGILVSFLIVIPVGIIFLMFTMPC